MYIYHIMYQYITDLYVMILKYIYISYIYHYIIDLYVMILKSLQDMLSAKARYSIIFSIPIWVNYTI